MSHLVMYDHQNEKGAWAWERAPGAFLLGGPEKLAEGGDMWAPPSNRRAG